VTTGTASADVTVGGITFSINTGDDSSSAATEDATKHWVDAQITIATSDTNGITESHTFTVTVEKDLGDGGGWIAAADQTVASDISGTGSITGGSCTTTVTDSNGQCTIIVNSNTAGTGTVNASTTVSIDGVDILVETDGYGAHDVSNEKTWIDGSLTWIKHDNNGQLLGGATFQVCRTYDRFGADIPDECVTVVDDSAPDTDPVAGQFKLEHLLLGRYTITETVAPPNYTLDPYVDTVELSIATPNGAATHIWVNTPGFEGCTPGFWQGGAGSQLWNEPNDPQWVYGGANPFIHTTVFNTFFPTVTDSRLAGKTMMDLVGSGGGSDWAVKAARDMVAAYLNESAFPDTYAATSLGDLTTMWYAAVAGDDATLEAFHTTVSVWNSEDYGGCPLP
jgi:uncharacterized surface anchored protein